MMFLSSLKLMLIDNAAVSKFEDSNKCYEDNNTDGHFRINIAHFLIKLVIS